MDGIVCLFVFNGLTQQNTSCQLYIGLLFFGNLLVCEIKSIKKQSRRGTSKSLPIVRVPMEIIEITVPHIVSLWCARHC